jgi:transcriptional regulator with XRE-family HTH domain
MGDQEVKNQALGEAVRARRLARGWSLADAANASGLHHSYWSKLENGFYQTPAPKYLQIIASVLEMPIEDLHGLAGYTVSKELPSFKPYLRAKYDLPPEAIAQLESYMSFLRNQYGIPKDQPVFPSKRKGVKTPKDSDNNQDRKAA